MIVRHPNIKRLQRYHTRLPAHGRSHALGSCCLTVRAEPHVDATVDNLVIGAGVVGLAIAARLSRHGSTLVLERNPAFGMETSSRNSEVIHAGIYYPPTSLKTQLCIRGNRLLYSLCAQHNISHRRTGKWIVATNVDQAAYLYDMKQRVDDLGVPVRFLSRKNVTEAEPNVIAHTVLESPTTGIVDSHALMACLEGLITTHGGDIAYRTLVASITPSSKGGYLIRTSDPTPFLVHARHVINAAGLYADDIASTLLPASQVPKIYPCKGTYYTFARNPQPVKRLVYPVPEKNLKGLGVHATVDMAGQVKFGPNAVYVGCKDDVTAVEDNELRESFAFAIGKYLRGVTKEDLRVDYAGVRPKLSSPTDPFHDFHIESPLSFRGFVNLMGIESPGLTASLAIAERVEGMLGYRDARNL